MLVVAKKPPENEPTPPRRGRARKLGTVRPVQVELPINLDDLVELFAQRTHRTKKGVILLALEQLLADEGLWPPPPEADDPAD